MVCLQGASGGSASWGGLPRGWGRYPWGGWADPPPPPELEKWAERILLECFLLNIIIVR